MLRSAHALRSSLVAVRQARCLGIIATGDPTKSHKEKNALRGRPMSPHVTVYAFPLAAIASITHRVTGVALVTGVYGMAFISLAGGDVAWLLQSIGNTTLLGMLVKVRSLDRVFCADALGARVDGRGLSRALARAFGQKH